MAFADDRTLEALDFGAVRDRVVAATRTQRGRSYAAELTPYDDFARVREEQRRTEAVRSLAAAVGATLAPADLRSVGDAIAAAAAAHRAAGEQADLAGVLAPYVSLRE